MHEATRQDAANRSTRRWPATWLALAIAALATTAMAAPEKILLAAEDDWPPYSSVRADRSGPEGFAVDVVREAFATQGVQVGFVVVPFALCMLMARTGEALGCFDATVLATLRADNVIVALPLALLIGCLFGWANARLITQLSAPDARTRGAG